MKAIDASALVKYFAKERGVGEDPRAYRRGRSQH